MRGCLIQEPREVRLENVVRSGFTTQDIISQLIERQAQVFHRPVPNGSGACHAAGPNAQALAPCEPGAIAEIPYHLQSGNVLLSLVKPIVYNGVYHCAGRESLNIVLYIIQQPQRIEGDAIHI